MNRTRHWARVRWEWAIVLLASYCFIAGGGARNGELFPFFHWSLFSTPKAVLSDHGLLVTELDGHTLSVPTYIEKLHLDGSPEFNVNYLKAIWAWGHAASTGDSGRLDMLRSNVEVLFRGHRQAKYFLVKRRYDPVSLFKTGKYENETIVGEYEYLRHD